MHLSPLLLLVGLGVAPNEQILDAFRYADPPSARRAWVASSGTPPVAVVEDGARTVLEFEAPFGSDQKIPRTVIDRDVTLDLAAPGQFTLEMTAGRPEAVAQVSLYFQSGEGWYAGRAGLRKTGWQTLTFSKASFSIEGKPAGWHKIDRIRISVWRGRSTDSAIRLGRLAAGFHDVALVIPAAASRPGDRDFETARETAQRVGRLLGELGLGSDTVEDTALAGGALGARRVAVLAYNPNLPAEAAAALEAFAGAGGKLLVCYTVPPRLARLLGLGELKHVPQARPGQFAEMRFDAAGVPGLPESVRQASWNVNVPVSESPRARVIGRWHDDEGKPTGHPALLLSDAGAFMTHLILRDDPVAKRQMLAAVLGRLDPALWRQMAQTELDRIGKVGHCDGFDQVAQYVTDGANPRAAASLSAAEETAEAARKKLALGAHPAAVEDARRAHELLVDAYLRAAGSRDREGRAFWNHSGTGAYPGDWERSARELAAAGFNMILPNMLWGGRAHYPSKVLPQSSTYRQYGDQVAQCVAACKKHGIEVHVWKVNWNLSGAPKEFVEKMRRAGRTQMTVTGEPGDWLCPSHPENLALELESMLEVARNYDVDGLHFDYIRYPNRSGCYCEGCRNRFEADAKLTVADWPSDCYSGELEDRYHDWRAAQITRLVAAVRREAGKVRPELKISAAVFGAYPQCRQSVGQDWAAWVKAGYLDFICPMNYTNSDLTFTNLLANQIDLVGGRIPIYPGIGATASNSRLTADRVVGQIHHARSLGAGGFTVFNFSASTADEIAVGVGLGAGSQPARPVHSQPEHTYYRTGYGRSITPGGAETAVWFCDATHKIPRQRPAPAIADGTVRLSAARNEFEAVQIVVRPTETLKGLTATARVETAGGLRDRDVQILRVWYHAVEHPTDKSGVADDWPDALPPLDEPIDVAAGENQPLWVLVRVPEDAAPGEHAIELELNAEGFSATVPIRLHVWDFALPEQNHIETAFGFSAGEVFRYHRLDTEADKRKVLDMYFKCFSEHRISPYDPAPLDPIRVNFLPQADPPRAELDFSAFDRAMARAAEEYHFTNFRLRLQGMGGGTFHARNDPEIAGYAEDTPQYQAMFSSYVGQVEEHLREKGWLDMAYVYWFDEPAPKDYEFVTAGMERLERHAPGLQRMITEQPEEEFRAPVHIWCPVSNNYDHAAAQERRAHGERFWWYVCTGPKAPYCGLFIDHPATELRVWLWQTWQRDIRGLLVWRANYWTSSAAFPEEPQNPYEDPMGYRSGYSTPRGEKRFWGNGDGRFIYPPLAAAVPGISGPNPVIAPPVSSIRWEMLRDGIEDYEYLHLLRDLLASRTNHLPPEQLAKYKALLDVPPTITRDMKTFTTDPAAIYARRTAIAEAIEQLAQ